MQPDVSSQTTSRENGSKQSPSYHPESSKPVYTESKNNSVPHALIKNIYNQKQVQPLSGYLGEGVATVNADIGTSHVLGGITEQEGNGTHQVLGSTHLAGGDERDPLVPQFGVLIQNLAGPVAKHN